MTAVRRAPNRIALALIGVGALLGVLAFSVLDWFGDNVGLIRSGQSTSGDLGDLLDRLDQQRRALGSRSLIHLGLSQYYYSWLGWLLLGAAVIVAFVAALPTEEGGPVRALGGLLSVMGLAATVWAIDVYRPAHDPRVPLPNGPGFTDFVSNTSIGAWCALAAFVFIGVGAALGPREVRAPKAEDAGTVAEAPSTSG